jgi:hypothetical protein
VGRSKRQLIGAALPIERDVVESTNAVWLRIGE